MKLLETEDLRLRPIEPEDLDLLYKVENDSSIWWIGGQGGPYSKFMLRQYLADATGDLYIDKQLRLVAIRKTDDVPVGMVDLFSYSPENHRAEVGILVFQKYRGAGFASQMLESLEQYCCRHLRLHQLYAYTPMKNEPGVKLFRSRTFDEEHIMKDWLLLEDGYADAYLFQKILR